MEQRRGALLRVGIVLLNLLAPGLGSLRLGRWKAALAFFSVSLTILLFFNFGPPVPFAVLVLVVAIGLGNLFTSMWFSWRSSRQIEANRVWSTRWYSVLGAAVFALVVNFALTDPGRLRYRTFYTPSEGMAPSLPKGDRFVAYMGRSGTFRRGDLVLVRTPAGDIYVKRVAALPGDRFAMEDGIVIVNGVQVSQHPLRIEEVPGPFRTERAQRLLERFPGEVSAHEIYDMGRSPGDDVAELIVRAGSIMLLGDNRDRSADSRFSVEEAGLGGPVPISDVAGRPYYQSWGSSRPMGTKLFE